MTRSDRSLKARESKRLFREFVAARESTKKLNAIAEESKDSNTLTQELLQDSPLYGSFTDSRSWEDFIVTALQLQLDHTVAPVLKLLHTRIQLARSSKPNASHQEKRRFVNMLGMQKKPPNVNELIKKLGGLEAARDRLGILGFLLVQRKRQSQAEHKFVRRRPLVESATDNPKAYLCDEANGFFIVEPDISAIFLGVEPDDDGDLPLELVVIRGVPMNNTYGDAFLQRITETIIEACHNRRDVRPNHGGKMVQIGWNMGARCPVPKPRRGTSNGPQPIFKPRLARVLGYAVSFTKKLSDDEKSHQDRELIGAMSILWALVMAYIPSDITTPVCSTLKAEYPTLATGHVPPGTGYEFELDDVVLRFSTSERAPPEGIATGGYQAHTHTDEAWLKWAFGWTATRFLPCDFDLPYGHGSSFVDMGLKVVVRSAPTTLSAFKPEELHGTTYSGGAINYGLSMTSTRRVREGYLELAEKGSGVEYMVPIDLHDE